MVRRNFRGFTIVELLIVIVVIAILATITLVVYNGMRDRAENIRTVNGVAAYIKAVKSFRVGDYDNGLYPVNTGYPCLGDVATTCGSDGTTALTRCWGVGPVSGRADFVSDIKQVLTNMPSLSNQTMTCNGTGSKAGGGFYYSLDGKTAYFYYFLKGNVDCGSPAGQPTTRNQAQDATYCWTSISGS